jgi:hypothetical protein
MIVRRVKASLAARKAKGLRLGRVPLQCVSYGSRFSSFLLNEPRLERPGIRPKSPLTARLAGDYFFPREHKKSRKPQRAAGTLNRCYWSNTIVTLIDERDTLPA